MEHQGFDNDYILNVIIKYLLYNNSIYKISSIAIVVDSYLLFNRYFMFRIKKFLIKR